MFHPSTVMESNLHPTRVENIPFRLANMLCDKMEVYFSAVEKKKNGRRTDTCLHQPRVAAITLRMRTTVSPGRYQATMDYFFGLITSMA